tara:strand:+ start:627 stop:1289 length:663 start_codon:yes stop_codon:yes gene_type:complete
MKKNKRGLIICGTDTDVGKTVISSLLVQGLNAIYWKPIQSGIESGTDTDRVRQLLNLSQERWIPEVYKFKTPVSPHWAAEIDNETVNPNLLQIPNINKPLIIETAGGLMVPLNRQFLQIDQLKNWGLEVLLVARSGLGTLNHTLLSIEALRKRDIKIIGLILNGTLHKDNPKTLEEFGGIPVIAQLPILEKLNSITLAEEWEKQNLTLWFNQYTSNKTST